MRSQIVGFCKVCDQNDDRVSKNAESCQHLHFVTKKLFLVNYEKYGTLSSKEMGFLNP